MRKGYLPTFGCTKRHNSYAYAVKYRKGREKSRMPLKQKNGVSH